MVKKEIKDKTLELFSVKLLLKMKKKIMFMELRIIKESVIVLEIVIHHLSLDQFKKLPE